MATTIEELQVLITGQTAGLRRELTKLKQHLHATQQDVHRATSGIASSFGKLAKIAAMVAIGATIQAATKEAMTFEASLQQVNRMMGESAGGVKKWAHESAAAFGMGRAEAMKYSAVYANLISGFTRSTAETAQYTKDLLKTAAVVASATGRTMTDTMERIRSGLLGNTEAIEDLGVNVNIAMIESTNAFKRFANGQSWAKLDFQTQQQIRLFAILEQAAAKYGVEMANHTASRHQQFVAQLKNIQLALGQAFLPIYHAILPALTTLAQALASIMNTVTTFMQALFGTVKTSSQVGAQVVQTQTAAVHQLGSAYDKTGKKAKASVGSIAGFDEVNRLAEPNKPTVGGEGGARPNRAGVGGIKTTAIPAMNTDGIPKKIQAMADSVKQTLLTLFEPLKKSWDKYRPGMTAAFQQAKDNWADIWRNTTNTMAGIWQNGGAQVIEHVSNLVLSLSLLALQIHNKFIAPVVSGLVNTLNPQINSAMQGMIDVVNTLLTYMVQFATYLGGDGFGYTQIALGSLAGALAGLAVYKTVSGIIGFMKEVNSGVKSLFIALAANPIMAVVVAVGALIGVLITAYTTNEEFRKAVDGLGERLKHFLIPVLETVKQVCLAVWNQVFAPLGLFLKNVFVAAWDAVAKTATFLWKEVLVPFGKLLQWLSETVLKPIGAILAGTLAIAFGTVAKEASILWKEILVPCNDFMACVLSKTINGVIEILLHWWNNVLKPIVAFVKNIFQPVFEALIKVFQFLWNHVLKPLATFLADVFLLTFQHVSKSVGDILSGLKKIFGGFIDFISGVFTDNWKKAWEGVKQIFKGVFESLWGIVKIPLNLIIGGINALIEGLNKLQFKLPDWDILGDYAGKDFGIHIPRIPHLARGGIVDSPTLAMIGEAGKEAVVPLENTSFIHTLASAIGSSVLTAQQMANSGQTSSHNREGGDIIIQVDGTTLARVLHPYLSQEQSRMGSALLKPI